MIRKKGEFQMMDQDVNWRHLILVLNHSIESKHALE